jgi:methylmalonyl-CoA mutase C-terminal domain/subunit
MSGTRQIRILVAKPGLDGHDRGAQVVARAFMDAGMEVIYTGIRQTPEMIVHAALQEDVDCVGLSMLSGGHVEHTESVVRGLEAAGAKDIVVIIGGIIPADDLDALRDLGVAGVFGPGSTMSEMVASVEELCRSRSRALAGAGEK